MAQRRGRFVLLFARFQGDKTSPWRDRKRDKQVRILVYCDRVAGSFAVNVNDKMRSEYFG